jgi:hypothetical protein
MMGYLLFVFSGGKASTKGGKRLTPTSRSNILRCSIYISGVLPSGLLYLMANGRM